MYNHILTKNIVVIYHGNCADGTSAAWCFKHYMNLNPKHYDGFNVEYWPADHRAQNMPEDLENRTVLMLDFTYTEKNMLKIIQQARVTIVLDHHDTAVNRLKACEGYQGTKLHSLIDMDRSGCQITWDVFHSDTPRPWFLDYIADRDMWKWEIPGSKEVCSALHNFYQYGEIDTYTKLYEETQENPNVCDRLYTEGQLLLQHEDSIVAKLKRTAVKVKFEGYTVLVASCPWMYRSELGNQLAQQDGIDFSALYTFVPPKFSNKTQEIKPGYFSISLRGMEQKGIELNKIAEKYGGGGHPLACGFSWHGKLEEIMTPLE